MIIETLNVSGISLLIIETLNVSGISLRRYSEAFPYCQIIKKEMRRVLREGQLQRSDQAYHEDELTMIDEISWQDVSALG